MGLPRIAKKVILIARSTDDLGSFFVIVARIDHFVAGARNSILSRFCHDDRTPLRRGVGTQYPRWLNVRHGGL